MAQLLPDKERQIPLAYLLLLGVIIAGYYLLVNGFVGQHFELSDEIADLREREASARQTLAIKPQLEQKLEEMAADSSNSDFFLKSNNVNLGHSELTQRLKQIISDVGLTEGQTCQVLSNSNVNNARSGGGPFDKVAIKVRLRCDLDLLSEVLYELETKAPYLFTDNVTLFMQVSKRRVGRKTVEQRNLDVRFDLAGYLAKT